MNTKKTIDVKILAILSGAVVLSGCVTLPDAAFSDLKGIHRTSDRSGPSLAPAALPTFAKGDRFLFDDGRAEEVIGIEGDVVRWKTSDGVERTSLRDPFTPFLSWAWGKEDGQAIEAPDSKSLWPLALGNYTTHHIKWAIHQNGQKTYPYPYLETWNCWVGGTERITVPAGTFDTYRVECEATDGPYVWQRRVFHYAPTVGHYVLRRDEMGATAGRQRQLVAYGLNSAMLPAKDQASLKSVVQRVLDQNPDGKAQAWKSAAGGLTARIVPTATMTRNGTRCRDYHGTFESNGHTRVNQRRACLDAAGKWVQAERPRTTPGRS